MRGEAAVARAMAAGQPTIFRAGERIIAGGEPHDLVYRLRTGWLCRVRVLPDGRRQIIEVLLPSDLFGVKSMFMSRQPDAVECLTDATVDCVDYHALFRVIGANFDAAVRVMWQLLEDERRLHNSVVSLGRGNADERMAAMLIDLYLRLHRLNLVDADRYRLPMTQRDIGDYLGLTTVHVGRVLHRFRERGLATIENRLVTLHNTTALAQIAAVMLDWCERTAVEAELHRPGLTDVGVGAITAVPGTSFSLVNRHSDDPAAGLRQGGNRSVSGDKPKRRNVSQLGRSLNAHRTAVTNNSHPSPQESEDELNGSSSK
jgi:CRP-like cAMP-binding protein